LQLATDSGGKRLDVQVLRGFGHFGYEGFFAKT
jgi:hypothetical protein